MNIDDAVQILRLHNQSFRCPAHIPDYARPPHVSGRSVAEAIDVVLRQLDQLQVDLRESDEVRDKMRHVLDLTARALSGPTPEGVLPSWHDLPQRALLAIRLADNAAEGVICTVGRSPRERQWVLYPEQIAADPYLEDCIAHLEWRGMADVDRESDGVRLTFRG